MNGEGNSVLGQSNLVAIENGDVTLYQLSNSPLVWGMINGPTLDELWPTAQKGGKAEVS